jgi:hypothetical protein
MRRNSLTIAGIAVLLAVPAVALGSSTTYDGEAIGDPQARIELKITDGSDREVRKVIARKLPYSGGSFCGPGSGRTGKIVVKDGWRVKENGEFRVVGQFDGGTNPLAGGQLNVVGDVGRHKVTGTVKFTYGKTGCQTDKLEFKAFEAA